MCSAAVAAAAQSAPVDIAALGIKKLAYEMPSYTFIKESAGEVVDGSGGPGSSSKMELTESRALENGSNIFVLDTQSPQRRLLVSGGSHPAWSPDGSQIAYCTWKALGFGQIEVVNADGTGKRQITDMKGGACFPDWSPDGAKIAFAALSVGDKEKNLIDASNPEIFVVDKNGGTPVPVAPGYAPRWSRGGTMLIFLRGPEKKGPNASVWLATADGQKSKVVATSDRRVAGVSWLPDGTGIAVSFGSGEKYAVYRMSLDGSGPQGNQPQKIAGDDMASFSQPVLSPDMKHLIAMKSGRCAGSGESEAKCSTFGIFFTDLDTRKDVVLAGGINFSVIWDRKQAINAP